MTELMNDHRYEDTYFSFPQTICLHLVLSDSNVSNSNEKECILGIELGTTLWTGRCTPT